jgi:hypothetical protein
LKNLELLKKLDECEYPAEFLVARLLGKKGALFGNWGTLIDSGNAVESLQNTVFYPFLKKNAAAGIWRFLRYEHLWVYKRMNTKLRKRFASYFVYHEINTLIVCLRYLSGAKQQSERVVQELHNSLLHNDIQDILTRNLDFIVILEALELRLCTYSDLFAGLRVLYEKKGIAALEIFMRNCFLVSLVSVKQPPMLKSFLQYMIDFHNCMALAKCLRWHREVEPILISGGNIAVDRFKRAYFHQDLAPVLGFLRLQEMEGDVSDIQKLETALLRFIRRKLQRWSLQRSVDADLLFYLWEQYCYTRNISLVLSTLLLDDEPVRRSIVA